MSRRRSPLLVVPALMLALLAGCSDDTGTTGTTGGDDDPREESADCADLSTLQVAALAGADVTDGPRQVDVQGLPACQWDIEGGAGVQTLAVPAEVWGRTLPSLLEQIEASGFLDDPDNQRKLAAGKALVDSGDEISADQACEVFSAMLEIQGVDPGDHQIVTLIPNRAAPQAVSAQYCDDGFYASVLLKDRSLSGSADEIVRARDALTTLIDSAR